MPGSQRQQRVQEQIKEVITEILPLMRDPRVGFVTVTGVEVAPDLSIARVFFSAYGSEQEQSDCLEALRRGAGFVRRELARRVQLRHTPELDFRLDTTPERADRIMKLLHQIEVEDASRSTGAAVSGPGPVGPSSVSAGGDRQNPAGDPAQNKDEEASADH